MKELERLSDRLFHETSALAEQCKDFCADRGLDSGPPKAKRWDHYRIRPLIDNQEIWQEEKPQLGYNSSKPPTRSLFLDCVGNVVHAEKGAVIRHCPKLRVLRHMVFQSFERTAARSSIAALRPPTVCSAPGE